MSLSSRHPPHFVVFIPAEPLSAANTCFGWCFRRASARPFLFLVIVVRWACSSEALTPAAQHTHARADAPQRRRLLSAFSFLHSPYCIRTLTGLARRRPAGCSTPATVVRSVGSSSLEPPTISLLLTASHSFFFFIYPTDVSFPVYQPYPAMPSLSVHSCIEER